MLITVLMPDGRVVDLQVADTDLIYNGQGFVAPKDAEYVELYSVPTQALTVPFNAQHLITQLSTQTHIVARVLGYDLIASAVTSPEIVAAVGPSDGQCVCFVTCSGTELRFIKVQVEEP